MALAMATTLVFLAMFMEVSSLNEKKRIVKGDAEFLKGKMEDIRSDSSLRQGKKRKVDDCQWMEEGERLIRESIRVLSHHPIGGWKNFWMAKKMRWDLHCLGNAIIAHIKEGDLVLEHAQSNAQGPYRGFRLPVKKLVGEVAFRTLDDLKRLFAGDKVGRIIIHGIEGIGKTHMMKHLHNDTLKMPEFDYIFWVSSPVELSIKNMQDAVAVAVNCDISSDDAIPERARKLSHKISSLGRVALFLDGLSKVDFSVEEIGIPIPAKGSKCKLVLATSSWLERSSNLISFEKVEIKKLSDDDAYTLFVHEVNIQVESVSSLGRKPRSFSDSCGGVPRRIVNLASRMCKINDRREWSCVLYELGAFEEKRKCLRSHIGESKITPSTSKSRNSRK